jgi:hypothetical protein
MMIGQQPTPLGRQVGEKIVKLVIALIGLFILRAILSALPMLRSPVLWMPSVSSAASTPQNPFGSDFAQIQGPIAEAMRAALGGKLPDQMTELLIQSRLAIFPVTIATALVDTVMFVVLVVFGRDVALIVRTNYSRLPDLGQMINLAVLTVVVAMAYYSYQGVCYPFLWPASQDVYGWVFLPLGLAPLVGIAVIVARNLDALTATVMRVGGTAVTGPRAITLGSCGHAMVIGAKFCPTCGSAANTRAVDTAPAKKVCPSCGAENLVTARFCKDCGHAV